MSAALNVGEEMTVLFAQEQPRCEGQIANRDVACARTSLHAAWRAKRQMTLLQVKKKQKRLFLNKKYFDCRIPGSIPLTHSETIS